MGKVRSPIQLRIRLDMYIVLVVLAVDIRSHTGKTSDKIHHILVHRIPILFLADSLTVGCSKNRLRLQRHNGHAELSHRVSIRRKTVQHIEYMLRHIAASRPLIGDFDYIFIGRQLTHQHQVKDPFWQRLCVAVRLWKFFPQLRNTVSAETNTFLGIQLTGFRHHSNHAFHTGVDLLDRILSNRVMSIIFNELLQLGSHRQCYLRKLCF